MLTHDTQPEVHRVLAHTARVSTLILPGNRCSPQSVPCALVLLCEMLGGAAKFFAILVPADVHLGLCGLALKADGVPGHHIHAAPSSVFVQEGCKSCRVRDREWC